GLRCCEEALAMSPAPFDAACTRAIRGYGRVRSEEVEAGVAELTEVLEWLDRAPLGYFRFVFAPDLAEGYLRPGERVRAQALIEKTLESSRGVSPRLEALTERLLGEVLMPHDVAGGHLDAAMRTFEELGARNELAKALATRAGVQRAAGDIAGARQ